MANHTPGPWHQCEVDSLDIKDSYNNLVAMAHRRTDDTTDEANARLIAGAADMFESLTALTGWMREHTGPHDSNSPHEILVTAMAVLAKMKG